MAKQEISYKRINFIIKEYQILQKNFENETEYLNKIEHFFKVARKSTRTLQRESALKNTSMT